MREISLIHPGVNLNPIEIEEEHKDITYDEISEEEPSFDFDAEDS